MRDAEESSGCVGAGEFSGVSGRQAGGGRPRGSSLRRPLAGRGRSGDEWLFKRTQLQDHGRPSPERWQTGR